MRRAGLIQDDVTDGEARAIPTKTVTVDRTERVPTGTELANARWYNAVKRRTRENRVKRNELARLRTNGTGKKTPTQRAMWHCAW